MKTLREMIDIVEGNRELTPFEAGRADGLSAEPYENPYPEGSESYLEFRKGWHEGYGDGSAHLDEALGKKDLLTRLQKDLPKVNDPKNKDAEPVNWTGPKKGDYGHTGYQGHGMPTDKQERDRIRSDKQKGVKEEATPEAVQKINKLFQEKK